MLHCRMTHTPTPHVRLLPTYELRRWTDGGVSVRNGVFPLISEQVKSALQDEETNPSV